MLSDLPKACVAVLSSPARSEAEATYGGGAMAYSEDQPVPAAAKSLDAITNAPPADVPLPKERPQR
jgi:penicillin-insensitive murein endopeptidase